MNRYSFIGNIGNDAEIRRIDSAARNVINFSVAVGKKWKDKDGEWQEKTTWIRCALWRKDDQLKIATYLTKGTKVYIEGEPTARAYMQGDEAKASLEVTVDNVELLNVVNPIDGSRTAAPASNNNTPVGNNPYKPNITTTVDNPDDDLPF